MADARNSSDSSSGHEDEIPTQYLRESHSQIGLSNNINQSSCLDSAFEFTYVLPRVFLPTGSDSLSVKAMYFVGTCHFLIPMVLKFLFNRMTTDSFMKQKRKLNYSDLCYTSSLTSWQELNTL